MSPRELCIQNIKPLSVLAVNQTASLNIQPLQSRSEQTAVHIPTNMWLVPSILAIYSLVSESENQEEKLHKKQSYLTSLIISPWTGSVVGVCRHIVGLELVPWSHRSPPPTQNSLYLLSRLGFLFSTPHGIKAPPFRTFYSWTAYVELNLANKPLLSVCPNFHAVDLWTPLLDIRKLWPSR